MPDNLDVKMQFMAEDDQVLSTLNHLIATLQKFEGAGKQLQAGMDGASNAAQGLAVAAKQVNLEEQKLKNESIQLRTKLQEQKNTSQELKNALEALKAEQARAKEESKKYQQETIKAREETKKYQLEMLKLKQNLMELGNAHKKQKQEMLSFAQSVDATNKKIQGFQNVLVGLGQIVGVTLLISKLKEVATITADINKSMNTIKAVKGASPEELLLLRKKAEQIGQSPLYAFSSMDVSKAEVAFSKAGFSVKETLEGVEGAVALATSTNADLAESVKFTTSTLNQFKKSAQDATKVADVYAYAINNSKLEMDTLSNSMSYIGPIAGPMNQKLEDTVAILMYLSKAGIESEKAGTAVSMSMTRLAGPEGDKARKLLKALNVELTQLGSDGRKRMRSFIDIFSELSMKMSTIKDDALKINIAKEIFGQESLKAAMPLLEDTTGAIKGLRSEIGAAGGSAQKYSEIMNSGLNKSIDAVTSGSQTLADTLGRELTPAFIEALDTITEFISAAIEFSSRRGPELNDSLSVLIDSFKAINDGINSVFSILSEDVDITALKVIVTGINAITSAASVALQSISHIIKDVGRFLQPSGIDIGKIKQGYLTNLQNNPSSRGLSSQELNKMADKLAMKEYNNQVKQWYKDMGAASKKEQDAIGQTAANFWENAANLSQNKARPETKKTSSSGGKENKSVEKFRTGVKVKFQNIIAEESAKYGVDPNLVTAVIRAESNFDPKARSPVGAQGLMQLMPGTAKGLGVKNAWDPKQNIAGGTKMLSNLMKTYGGDLNKVLWAYNAGGGNVAKGILPKETRNYIAKVRGFYNEYSGGGGGPADTGLEAQLAKIIGGKGGREKKPKKSEAQRALERAIDEERKSKALEKYRQETKIASIPLNLKDEIIPKIGNLSLEKMGLDSTQITQDFKDFYTSLLRARQDYNENIVQENAKLKEITEKAQSSQLEIEKKFQEKMAEARAKYEAKQEETKSFEGAGGAATAQTLAINKGNYEREQAKINADYQDEVQKLETETNKAIIDLRTATATKTKELYEQETRALDEELKSQHQLRERTEEDNKQLIIELSSLREDTANRQKILQAQISHDEMALINLEAQQKESAINKQMRLDELATAQAIKNINKEIQEWQNKKRLIESGQIQPSDPEKALLEINKTIKTLDEQRVLKALEGNEKVNAAQQDRHEAEMDRIEKEMQAERDKFEASLGFLEKILGFAGKFMGENNIVSKIAGMIGQYKSTIADVFKMFISRNVGTTAQQGTGNIIESIPTVFNGGGIGGQITGAAANLASDGIENFGTIFGKISTQEAKSAGVGVDAISELGNAAAQAGEQTGGKAGGLRGLLGLGKANPLLGSLAGAGAGGFAGYSMGSEMGPLGMLGGAATGAMTGFGLGGLPGAAVGAGVGLIGGLIGWLFGGRSKKEMKRLDSVTKQANTGLAESQSALTGVQSAASRAKLMNEMQEVKARADAAMSQVLQQESYMLTELNPANFKSKKARRAAAQAQSDMAQKVFEQKQAAEDLQRQAQEAIRQRQNAIEDTQRSLYAENFKLSDAAVSDPFRFSGEEFYGQQLDSNTKYTQTVRDFADDPQILEMAKQARLKEMKIIQRQSELGQVEKGGNQVKFYAEVEQEKLKASDAGSIAEMQAEKKEALELLRFDMQKLRIEMGDNQELLTKITELEAAKRKNIEKEYQEQIQDEYKKTAGLLADLLKRRDEIAGQFDFKRSKSRVDIMRDQLSEVDKRIREEWPKAMKDMANINPEMLNSMSPDQLSTINEQMQQISNFSSSKSFDSVININLPPGSPAKMVNDIIGAVNTALDNQKRYATNA